MKSLAKSLNESIDFDDDYDNEDITVTNDTIHEYYKELLENPDVIKKIWKLLNANNFNMSEKLKRVEIETAEKEYIETDEFGNGPFIRIRVDKLGKCVYSAIISSSLSSDWRNSHISTGWVLYSRKKGKKLIPAELVSDKDKQFYYTTLLSPDHTMTYTVKSDKFCVVQDNYVDINVDAIR